MTESFWYPLPYRSLFVSGADRSAFLQRQVSNDLGKLRPGMVLPSALTAPTGKTIDLLLLFDSGEQIQVVSMGSRLPETARYLSSRIFFMDKVTVTAASAPETHVALWGAELEVSLQRLGVSALPDIGQVLEMDIQGRKALLYRLQPPLAFGPLLLLADDHPPLLEQSGFRQASDTEYETARIQAATPGAPELAGEFTPYELRLDSVVSTTKGCYTGQEVLARQVTYDKITRRLCQVRLDQPAPAGAKVYAGTAPAGELTSISGNLALAVLRRPHFEGGTRLTVRWEQGETQGTVV